jgi:hypothetical protein
MKSSSNLAPRELYRYDWRVEMFLSKFRNQVPLTLVNGDESVTLVFDDRIETLIMNRSRDRIVLQGTDGKSYSLSSFAKTAEFGGGSGSGGGVVMTKLTEAAQAVYAQSRMLHRYSMAPEYVAVPANLSVAYSLAKVDETLDAILNDLPSDWKQSCLIGAKALNDSFNDHFYQFHRGSDWVNSLEALFKKLNAKEEIFSNLNKWSPADIYMISNFGMTIDFSSVESIAELNKVLVDAMESRDILGVSLKYLNRDPKITFHNVGKVQKEYQLDRVSTGLTGFFSSKDALIYFGEKDKIQFRTFPETFQGEIKGRNANHGKISYGPLQTILRSLSLPPLSDQKQLRKRIAMNDSAMLDEFYFTYRTNVKNETIVSIDTFTETCLAKGPAWMFSKFLSLQLVNNIVKFGNGNEFITACIRYASSSSELSAPFVKLE